MTREVRLTGSSERSDGTSDEVAQCQALHFNMLTFHTPPKFQSTLYSADVSYLM